MNPNPKVRTILLCAAILSCVVAIVAFEDAGEVLSLGGASWVAIAIALVAGALL